MRAWLIFVRLTRRNSLHNVLDLGSNRSLWIRAICTQPVILGAEQLQSWCQSSDFVTLAENRGLPEDVGELADEYVCCESTEERNVILLHYMPENEHFIRVELWNQPESQEEIDELKEYLHDLVGPGVEKIGFYWYAQLDERTVHCSPHPPAFFSTSLAIFFLYALRAFLRDVFFDIKI